MLFTIELLFGVDITAIKMSVLVFYYSIFSVSETFARLVKMLSVLCLIWLVVVTFIVVFQCNPVQAFWEELNQSPYCHCSAETLLGYEITNLFLDVIILCLPIGMIWKLNMPGTRKATVASMLLLGSLYVRKFFFVNISTKLFQCVYPEHT